MLLLGRKAERARLEELLGGARQGKSGSLLIHGEAGAGKSALLQYAADQAQADMTMLSARGLESESELAFASLADLVRPILYAIDRIPAAQAAALTGALALGPAVPGDRFAAYAATLSLLAAAADHAPVLALVDDLHWLDSASAEALLFVARRLGNEGIVLLFAKRDEEDTTVDFTSTPDLRITGLQPTDAVQLLRAGADRPIELSVAHALAVETAGNPLALTEIPSLLSDAQLAGAEVLPEPLPAGQALERAFMRRLAPLSPESRRALLVAAASMLGDTVTIGAALQSLRLNQSHLEEGESAGLITIENGRLDFRHPLLRSAIYHSARPAERRAAHRCLAAAFKAGDNRRAWHLAAAAVGPDDEVADLLEQAANEAGSRSAYGAGASALERAARLSTRREAAIRRLTAAGEAARFAGQTERSLALFQEALSLRPPAIAQGKLQLLRGETLMWRGRPMEAYQLLVEEAEKVKDLDRGLAATMLVHAVGPCMMDGRIATALATSRRAFELAASLGGLPEASATAALGECLLLNGQGVVAAPYLMRSIELGEPTPGWSPVMFYTAFCLVAVEQYDTAFRLLEPAVRFSREKVVLGILPYPLAVFSDLQFRTGHWDWAYAVATESVRIGMETDQESVLGYCLVCLARIEAGRGLDEACRSHVAQALVSTEKHETSSLIGFARAALGLLELGIGAYPAAFDQLEAVRKQVIRQEMLELNVIPYFADLAEAAIRLGRINEAVDLLDEYEAQARRTERNWAIACVERCRGLLGHEPSFEQHFRQALALHRQTPTPFEEARTELCFGETLRRHRRRIEARDHLKAALAVFERLGAQPWANRARAELAATGEHARSRKLPPTRDLTAQELQVALLVAEGGSNQEVASRLFLSPKTIEAHLTTVYAKLGLRSRAQLAHLFAAEPALTTTHS